MTEPLIRTLVIGGLATLAALLFERGLAHLRMGTRFAWTFALVATLVLPFTPRLLQTSVSHVVPQLTAPAIVITTTSGLESRMPIDVLRAVAIVLPVGVALFYGVAFMRLLRARRRWRASRIADHEVYLSDEFGPAVFGFTRPRIVVPEWVQATSAEEQQLIVLHEREHIAAKDQLQLLLTLLATVVMPWNPFVWLQARALRFRVETDCDQRVLALLPDRARYAELLMDVGSKQNGLMLTPALAEHRNGLERRLTMLASRLIENRWKALGLMTAGIALTIVACESRLPNEVAQPEPQPMQVPVNEVAFMKDSMRQVVHLIATSSSADLIDKNYPPLLRSAGIGGVVMVKVTTHPDGRTEVVGITKTSGHDALDKAALKVAGEMKLLPSPDGSGKPAGTETRDLMLVFDPNSRSKQLMPTRVKVEEVSDKAAMSTSVQELDDRPRLTLYDTIPSLANREEIGPLLARSYPPLLRDAGIGGTTLVWVKVNADGNVSAARVKESSGRNEIDAAALTVAKRMRFTPARNKGAPVSAWIQLPIVFRVE